jgi:hypothetical protein
MNKRGCSFPVSVTVVASVILLSACQMTKPKADFTLQTSDLHTEGERPFVSRSMALPNEWFADNISLEIDEVFAPTESGMEVLASRTVKYTRLTNPDAAAQVAMVRSEDSSDLGKAITSAGTTVLVEAIGAQLGIATAEIAAAIERAKIEAEARKAEAEAEAEPEPEVTP